MIGSIGAALFIVKCLESDDGSTTPLALILAAAMAFGLPTTSFVKTLEKASTHISAAADKISTQQFMPK
jgi:hypothetical protein